MVYRLRPSHLILAALAVAIGCATVAPAQSIDAERKRLANAKAASAAATERSARLERQSRRERDEAARTRADEAAVAARIQAAEADIAAAQARVAIVERLRRAQRARLAAKQGPIVRLVAALQMMARRPPAMAVVQPGSLTDMVHVRAMLATILPVIAKQTQGLRAEIDAGKRLQADAVNALATLEQGQQRLVAERLALARIEAAQRRRSIRLSDDAAFESERAIALGEKARDIGVLMDELGSQAKRREALMTLPGPLPRPSQPGKAAAPRAARTVARQASGTGYRLPVIGEIVTGMGEISAAGVRARGLTIATRPGAQVIAPRGGRIVFAGPYRGFERIAIIDHGGGLTTLITNLAGLSVKVGDIVDQGSPIGRAGPDRPTVTVELRRDGQPVDITRLIG